MRTFLIISPHLDDAVLSCGASMAKWVADGDRVVVATVFTSCADHSPQMQALYKKRKRQDKEALERLGCGHFHMEFTDAPFRTHAYQDFSTILFHHEPAKGELVQAIALAIASFIKEVLPDFLMFPLGVGGHVDHNIVYWSSLQVAGLVDNVAYYEELPYALVPLWTALRLSKLGVCPFNQGNNNLHLNVSPISLSDLPLPFLRNYMVNKADLKRSDAHYQKEMIYLKSTLEASETKTESNVTANKIEEWIDNTFFLRKWEAIKLYQTEWKVLFGEPENNILEVLHPTFPEAYQEYFWTKN